MNNEIIFKEQDPEGRYITLTTERWEHVTDKHPEVKDLQEVKKTVRNPHLITSRTERQSLTYTKYSSTSLSIRFNVISRMNRDYTEGDIITVFLTTKDPKGEIIWSRSE